jgi:hypothetical protein
VKLAVAPGRYLLRRESEQSVYGRELTVEAGKTVQVSEASLSLVGNPLLAAKGVPLDTHKWEVGFGLIYGMTGGSPPSWLHPRLDVGCAHHWIQCRPELHLRAVRPSERCGTTKVDACLRDVLHSLPQ